LLQPFNLGLKCGYGFRLGEEVLSEGLKIQILLPYSSSQGIPLLVPGFEGGQGPGALLSGQTQLSSGSTKGGLALSDPICLGSEVRLQMDNLRLRGGQLASKICLYLASRQLDVAARKGQCEQIPKCDSGKGRKEKDEGHMYSRFIERVEYLDRQLTCNG
jgi:hypothetical protein